MDQSLDSLEIALFRFGRASETGRAGQVKGPAPERRKDGRESWPVFVWVDRGSIQFEPICFVIKK
jgi:hypothetical protein